MERIENDRNKLLGKLELLQQKQFVLQKAIDELKEEIFRLKTAPEEKITKSGKLAEEPEQPMRIVPQKPEKVAESGVIKKQKDKNAVERFIGENLISKIGIAILVIGISIGVKYAIDHDLISPVVRIILGYLAGFVLLFFAIRLRKNYGGYSAVLLSGAMASMYFITYAAFSYYSLFPRWIAFGLMVLLTVFTVLASIQYNRQVIAHIGLVGACAIPFLLSDPDAKIWGLFIYMVIINAGILFISYRRYWKLLNYSSFILTWLIYLTWFIPAYKPETDSGRGLLYAALFFTLFYGILMIYKLVKQEKYNMADILFLLANSFVFFGIGYSILERLEPGVNYLGLFTLINAFVHGGTAFLISVKKPADKNIFYFTAGLAIVFLTIAIPVQLDGRWVTLLWAGEAAVIFFIGRRSKTPAWEMMSGLLMLLAFGSIIHDWASVYRELPETPALPVFNTRFLSSAVFCGFFLFTLWVDGREKDESKVLDHNFLKIQRFIIVSILMIVVYVSFFREISTFWDQKTENVSNFLLNGDIIENGWIMSDIKLYKSFWLINYSLLFISALSFANTARIRNSNLGAICLFLNLIILISYLGIGFENLNDLRESYLKHLASENNSVIKIILRYVSFGFLGMVLYFTWETIRKFFYGEGSRVISVVVLHIILVILASSELVNWLEIFGSKGSDKLGLSILWGIYSLYLIVIGIWKNRKYLRVLAIILFGITLLKLFFYDLTYLDTLSKTIVFVILGSLLLIISFLYTKFKHLIFEETDKSV